MFAGPSVQNESLLFMFLSFQPHGTRKRKDQCCPEDSLQSLNAGQPVCTIPKSFIESRKIKAAGQRKYQREKRKLKREQFIILQHLKKQKPSRMVSIMYRGCQRPMG